MKRGEPLRQPFIYIFTLIVSAFVIYFGFTTVASFQRESNLVALSLGLRYALTQLTGIIFNAPCQEQKENEKKSRKEESGKVTTSVTIIELRQWLIKYI